MLNARLRGLLTAIPNAQSSLGTRNLHSALLCIGAAVFLCVAIFSCWWASTRQGGDFIYPYILSHSVMYGEPIYDRQWQLENIPRITGQARPGEGIFYPPGTGFSTLPLVAFSFPHAQILWLAILIGTVVLGTRALMNAKLANNTAVWMALAGVVLFSAATRWGMTPLQGAPLIMGLLCLFVASIEKARYCAAFAITTFVLTFKFTVALPFVGLLLLHRKWRKVAGALAIAGLAHVLAFARVGGTAAFGAYVKGVSGLQAPGSLNTPDPWDPMSSPRIDWTYLYTGLVGDPLLTRYLCFGTAALVAIWLLWLAWRLRDRLDRKTTALMLLALVCFGNLCVYHHHYDVSAALVPIIMLAEMRLAGLIRFPRSFLFLMMPLVGMMALLPVAVGQKFLLSLGGPHAAGYMNIAFPISLTLALIASCFHLTRLGTDNQNSAPAKRQFSKNVVF